MHVAKHIVLNVLKVAVLISLVTLRRHIRNYLTGILIGQIWY